MRIATASQFQRSVDIIQQRQQALQSTQEQLISGKRIARDAPIDRISWCAPRWVGAG